MAERQPYDRLLERGVSEARLARNLAAVRRRQVRARVGRARLAGAATVVALVGLLLATGVLEVPRGRAPGPLHSRERPGQPLRPEYRGAEGRPLQLDDGSRLHFGQGAQLSVVDNDGERFRTLLHSGWVRYEVQPGGPRRWAVEAGLLQVEVVGTAFTVSRTAEAVRVLVHRGRVLVRGNRVPGGVTQLRAGDSLEVRQPTPERAPSPAIDPVAHGPAPAPGERPPTTETPNPSGDPARAVRRSATPKGASRPDSARALDLALHLADELREQGRMADAAAALRDALERDGAAPGAGLAALTLGRLELELPGQARAATRHLGQASRLALPRGLREQAQALRVQALRRSGEVDAARRAADAYRQAYPRGAWSAWVDSWDAGSAGP